MCLAITKKGTLCKNKNCVIHINTKERDYILSNARELLYLTVGSSWTSQKKYIDGYMQLSLWLLTQEPTSYI